MKENFTVGFSGNTYDLEQLLDASKKINSVYTGGLKNMISGGRPQYISSMKEIEDFVSVAHRYHVNFEIAINAPCGIEDTTNKKWWNEIRDYLKELELLGVTGIIASHPFIISAVKALTHLKVIASTICEIQSCRSALYYEDIGADVIIPSMNCNYNLQLLNEMKNCLKKSSLRLMVNEHCLGDCPWRRFHHSHYAHSNYELDYHIKCKKTYWDNPYLLLTNSVIRPEDLIHYEGIINNFKIVGRQIPIESLTKIVKAYDKNYYDGNYVDLFDIKIAPHFYISNQELNNLFTYKSSCHVHCHKCSLCKELYENTKN